MSHRPILKKKANRVRKMMRATPPAFIDLVAWLKMAGHANTSGEARRLILARRVKSESHVLGIGQGQRPKQSSRLKALMGLPLTADDYENVPVVEPLVPAKLRGSIYVTSA